MLCKAYEPLVIWMWVKENKDIRTIEVRNDKLL